jgi:hypothetical protein
MSGKIDGLRLEPQVMTGRIFKNNAPQKLVVVIEVITAKIHPPATHKLSCGKLMGTQNWALLAHRLYSLNHRLKINHFCWAL